MITICAHCKKVIAETARRDNRISHGICNKCLARLEKELQANSKSGTHRPAPKAHLKKVREASR